MEKEPNGDTEQLTGRTDRQGEYSAICLFRRLENRRQRFAILIATVCHGKKCLSEILGLGLIILFPDDPKWSKTVHNQ